MAESKESIMRAAIGILAKNPHITYSDLAAGIGIGRATLYRHFPNREALLREICLYALKQSEVEMMPVFSMNLSAMDTLYAMLEKLIPMGEQLYFLAREYSALQDEEIVRIYEGQLTTLQNMVRAAKAEGGIAPDIPDAWIVRIIDNIIYAAWEAINDGDIARNDAVELVFRTLIEGLRAK